MIKIMRYEKKATIHKKENKSWSLFLLFFVYIDYYFVYIDDAIKKKTKRNFEKKSQVKERKLKH